MQPKPWCKRCTVIQRAAAIWPLMASLVWTLASPALAQTANPVAPIVVSGTVPSQTVQRDLVTRIRELYSPREVIDQLKVADVAAPPEWANQVKQLLIPSLKQVSRGQLSVMGSNVELVGEIANDTQRQQLMTEMRKPLPAHYTVKDALQVAPQEQGLLDRTLANRIIEFERGSAVLRPAGKTILDEMATALLKIGGKKVELIGHTDAQGNPTSNLALSQARAEAVRVYLIGKGVSPALLSAAGMGAQRPIAPNDTETGRARNRRIEFRISQ
jgi:OmpA-OmpF porin, OOP family